jgi:hypothetical protein
MHARRIPATPIPQTTYSTAFFVAWSAGSSAPLDDDQVRYQLKLAGLASPVTDQDLKTAMPGLWARIHNAPHPNPPEPDDRPGANREIVMVYPQ